jgi:hypothetical protein
MNGREYFHESVVRDIVDVLTSLKDYDEVQFINNAKANRSFKSVTSATKDLILTFPVLVSSDIEPDNAIMIAKAHEKKMASLLHILFTAISVGNNEDVFDYVKKFHSNMGSMNGTLDSYMDSFDRLATTFGESYDATLKIDKAVLESVLEDLKESNYTLPDNVKESSLESYKIIPGYRTGMNDRVVHEADDIVNLVQRRGFQNDKNYADYMKNMAEFNNKAILNTEYKKANELQPTMMIINFMRHSETCGSSINTAVIGIKAKIYPVTSADICNRISGKLDDKNILTNFIRATTNEIAFFRDFLFAVDNAKLDAKSYGKNASSNKLWKVLERRSTKSKFRRSLKMYNDATAISTLVLSENDAEYLKKVNNIDILNVQLARKILDSYNFMCIAVLNQSTEVASILYDTGDDTFEVLPFSGLEREASDNSYKKMVNLLAKVSR